MNKIKVAALVVFSAGWILPVCLSLSAFLNYVKLMVIPQITGRAYLTGFPFDEMGYALFVFASIWLACAIGFWVAFFLRKRRNETTSAAT